MATDNHTQKTATSGKYFAILAFALLALYMCSGGSSKRGGGTEVDWWQASHYWDTSTNIALTRALVKARTPGCGNVRWKPHQNLPYTVAAQCSRDGEAWVTYIVDTDRQTVAIQ